MRNPSSKSYRYFYVFLNMTMLLSTVVIMSFAVTGDNHLFMLVPGLGTLIILVFSTVKIYLRTGVWKFIHSNSENMDERELALARMAVQKAYAVFTVTILGFVMILSIALSYDATAQIVSKKSSSLWIVLAGFIYFAHSLPAVFIVLREKYLNF
jgi:hypothetical protein